MGGLLAWTSAILIFFGIVLAKEDHCQMSIPQITSMTFSKAQPSERTEISKTDLFRGKWLNAGF